MSLQQTLFNLRMGENMSLTSYIARIDETCRRLKDASCEVANKQKVAILLSGLHVCYSMVKQLEQLNGGSMSYREDNEDVKLVSS